MRLPRGLAWLLVLGGLFTAALLRSFHTETPRSPFVPPVVGSLLFAGVFLLLLVSAREWRLGGAPGGGIRLGSLTPLLLMLLMEKWTSLSLYNPLFYAISPSGASDEQLDTYYVAFGGVGLVLLCVLFAGFSKPAARTVRRRLGARGWGLAAIVVTAALFGTYALVLALARAIGADVTLVAPDPAVGVAWVVASQCVLAFGEELYYRGLLLAELHRLGPRLGLGKGWRRWFAILATGLLFGLEHVRPDADAGALVRQVVFAVGLGVLFGFLVLATRSLALAFGLHAAINVGLLGGLPQWVDPAGRAIPDSGAWVGIVLAIAFCATAAAVGLSRRARARAIAAG